MSVLPVREADIGPEERSMRARALEARRRLLSGSTPPPKAIVHVKPVSPFDPRRVQREIEEALALAVASHPEPPIPPWKVVLAEVSEKHDVPVSMIVGTGRSRSILPARYEAAYRMVHELGMSLLATGRRLNRDHTTILHSIKRHLGDRPGLKAKIEAKKADDQEVRVSLDDEILRLYFDEGKSVSAISRALDVSRPSIHSLVHREIVRVREARQAA